MYFKKNLRILVNGQAMATWPDALKIAKMAKNSHLWTHWSKCNCYCYFETWLHCILHQWPVHQGCKI
jgi:hypothetical protein